LFGLVVDSSIPLALLRPLKTKMLLKLFSLRMKVGMWNTLPNYNNGNHHAHQVDIDYIRTVIGVRGHMPSVCVCLEIESQNKKSVVRKK
jgi:hypothetical protein